MNGNDLLLLITKEELNNLPIYFKSMDVTSNEEFIPTSTLLVESTIIEGNFFVPTYFNKQISQLFKVNNND